MKILFLAPQPFYQERGTPIAVRLAAEVLASRDGDSVTLLTYEEGSDIVIPNVSQRRVRAFPRMKNIPPGFSLKKLYTDIFFFGGVVGEIWKNRKEPYALIHAVEESVFMALLVKLVTGIPYIYDMDSSLSLQLVEKISCCTFLLPLFQFLENLAIRNSIAVVPVCDALAVLAKSGGSRKTLILRDISLLDYHERDTNIPEPDLRKEAKLPDDAHIILYIGNLERYQGIDLLVEAFASIWQSTPTAHLLILGGREDHIANYEAKCAALGIPESRAQFLGPRPVSSLSPYLQQADILTSPRVLGNNTPMKIYSYLHSGTPIVATDLPTHTQVLNTEVSRLVDAEPVAFGQELQSLLNAPEERNRIRKAAIALAEAKYTFEVFEERLNELYNSVGGTLGILPDKPIYRNPHL